MRYLVLACDYDGTLAKHGIVDETTCTALARCRDAGRKVVLVSGREVDDLRRVSPPLEIFDRVVAENGGVLFRPASQEERLLCEPANPLLVHALIERGVAPLSAGRTIVATWHPHEETVLRTIRELGLELQVIFNKGAVMVLPSGVNKASGLKHALRELHISPHNVVAVADAENDHAFFELCEASAAVANALPSVKQRGDLVTAGDHGRGVQEVIDMIVADDICGLDGRLTRHHLLLGHASDGQPVRLSQCNANLLIAGPSGAGKSSLATAILERLAEHKYQFCVIDPEGDYDAFEPAIVFGTSRQPPVIEEVTQLIQKSTENVVINMIDIPARDRPAEFMKIMGRLEELRSATGRPHWILVDEAHHVLPVSGESAGFAVPKELDRVALVTVDPPAVMPSALKAVQKIIALGPEPYEILARFAATVSIAGPHRNGAALRAGEILFWDRQSTPLAFVPLAAKSQRRRHERKYVEGDLGADRSFYFRGRQNRLNLRAQNLLLFLQLAEGVDDDTWEFHRQQQHYSAWLRDCVKDESLSEGVAGVEREEELSPADSRARIRALIEQRYTLPAALSGPAAPSGGDKKSSTASPSGT